MGYKFSVGRGQQGDIVYSSDLDEDTKIDFEEDQIKLVANGTEYVTVTTGSVNVEIAGTAKSNFYTTTVTTQDLGSGTNSDLSTASGIVLLDADSINGIDMGGGMEVHSLAFPTPSTSGQKLTIIAKNANTNNTFIVPSGLISGSFSQLHDGSGISALSFVWISEGTHKAWYQV